MRMRRAPQFDPSGALPAVGRPARGPNGVRPSPPTRGERAPEGMVAGKDAT